MPHPQSESSITPEIHGRKEKHREKEKNTKTGEILVSEESKTIYRHPRLMMSSEWDGKVDSTFYKRAEQCTKDVDLTMWRFLVTAADSCKSHKKHKGRG